MYIYIYIYTYINNVRTHAMPYMVHMGSEYLSIPLSLYLIIRI